VWGAVGVMSAERVGAAGEMVGWARGGGEEVGGAGGVEARNIVLERVILAGWSGAWEWCLESCRRGLS
jgi:hypothetical protein